MNGDKTMDLDGLLERVMSDPIAVVGAVLQQVLIQLAPDGATAGDEHKSPEELIASVLANRLEQGIIKEEPPRTADVSAEDLLVACEELVDRNSMLAAALGACDCWGQHAECPICDGAGGPGWVLPDRRFFATYVNPAMRAMNGHTGESAIPQRTGQGHRRSDDASDLHSAMKAVRNPDASPDGAGLGTEDNGRESEDAYELAR